MPVLLLTAAVVFFRIAVGASADTALSAWANFSPMAALALCAGAVFPKKWAIAVPIGAQLVVDSALHLLKPHPFNAAYSVVLLAAFAAVFFLGRWVRQGLSLRSLLGGAILGTIVFYLVTNTASFFYDPSYQKNLAGWWQSLTTGVPGFPPTYVFLLKSLFGDLLFATLIGLACGLGRRQQATAEEEAPLPA